MRLGELTQVGEGLTQVVGRGVVGHLAPQQAGEGIALVRPAGDGQIRQQGGDLAGHETGHGQALLFDLQSAQQTNF